MMTDMMTRINVTYSEVMDMEYQTFRAIQERLKKIAEAQAQLFNK